MQQIALFGGSFNPPHVAHQMVCLVILETCEVDAVWMVPTYRHAFAKELADFDARVAMCELLARPLGSRVEVSRIECEIAAHKSRTLDTLLELRERHPETRFRLVIGADILAETGKWYRWPDVEALAPPIVVGRSGYSDVDRSQLGAAYDVIGLDLPTVSSTEVRARLAECRSGVPLLSRPVMKYIAERGLYGYSRR